MNIIAMEDCNSILFHKSVPANYQSVFEVLSVVNEAETVASR